MKNYQIMLAVLAFALSSCGVNNTGVTAASDADISLQADLDSQIAKGVHAIMQISDTIKIGQPVALKFTVHNPADTTQQFCKWHTPFEPLMSKYLDIKDENGLEVDYRGVMAKRIMPPPADSYIKVNPKDSLVSIVDLLKGYAITKPSTYTITYSGQNMSGLIVRDSISFVYR